MRSFVVAIIVTIGAAASASAQSIPTSAFSFSEQSGSGGRPHSRGGVWFSGGLGFGSLGCEDCDERELSGILDLAVGATVGERLLIGGALTGWSKAEDGVTLTVTSLEARLRFYPIAAKGFYLTGGLGVGGIRVDVDNFGDESE